MGNNDSWGCIVSAIVGVALLLWFGVDFLKISTRTTVDIFVNRMERVNYVGDSKYLVFTDGEVFENTDFWLLGKFNSSDVYGSLHENWEYTCDVVGWRIPLFSMYRNIINCHEK